MLRSGCALNGAVSGSRYYFGYGCGNGESGLSSAQGTGSLGQYGPPNRGPGRILEMAVLPSMTGGNHLMAALWQEGLS